MQPFGRYASALIRLLNVYTQDIPLSDAVPEQLVPNMNVSRH